MTNITPVHESGAADSVKNYRPISLTSIPCQILEHIVLRNLLAKVDRRLPNKQHGFWRGLSCKTQLCATLNDILSSVDRHKSVHAAVLDFSKAFDRVPHTLLMEKLSMIHSFLHGRSQRVILNGRKSSSLPVTSGVPQGSVFEPVLFLLFINDVPESVDCSVALFANDTLLYQEVTTTQDMRLFQHNLTSLGAWAIRAK